MGLYLMDGGSSKLNPPNSHPSNQIHKEAHRKAPPPATTKSRRKQGDALCGRSYFAQAVKLEALTVAPEELSH